MLYSKLLQFPILIALQYNLFLCCKAGFSSAITPVFSVETVLLINYYYYFILFEGGGGAVILFSLMNKRNSIYSKLFFFDE